MVKQVCHIEEYNRQVFAQEDRNLSGEEAARERSVYPLLGLHSITE